MAVCAALEGDDVKALEAIMTSTRLDANEALVQAGDPRRKVFTLTAGMLRLSVGLPDGRRQITGFLMPGDYLGLSDDDVYTATAEAVEPATLCAFSVGSMDALVERFPKLKDRLHGFTRAALRQARETQLVLGRLTPLEKLATFLILLSRRAVEHKLPASPVRLPMPRGDIADYLGLTVETVSRSFTKLRHQKLIAMPDPHSIEIVNAAALTALAGLTPSYLPNKAPVGEA